MWMIVETAWFMSSDDSEPVDVYGPYESEEAAMEAVKVFQTADREANRWATYFVMKAVPPTA